MKFTIIFFLLTIASAPAHAKTLWSDFSVSYLSGKHYKVGDSDRNIVTFEYANSATWGDTFLFFDRIKTSNDNLSTYGEFSPRIKIIDFNNSFISNLYFTPSVEMGTVTNYLIGVGTNLNIQGFNYCKISFYLRDNEIGDNSFQTTLSWGVPIGSFLYDGFIDYATGVDNTPFGDTKTQMNMTSQLKYNIGPLINMDSKLYLGVEYVYWLNKFGIDTVNEHNANLLIKYHF